MDVILPFKNRGQLRMRLVARPDKPVAELLAYLGLALPSSRPPLGWPETNRRNPSRSRPGINRVSLRRTQCNRRKF